MKEFLVLIFILQSFSLVAQKNNDWLKMGVFDQVTVKLQYERVQKLNNIDVGLMFANGSYDHIVQLPWTHWGPYIDLGLSWQPDGMLMTNKLGYEYVALFVVSRLNFINYTNFENNQVCLRPEIGICYSSLISLTYGYNFDVTGKDSFAAEGHVVAFNLAIPITNFYHSKNKEQPARP